MRKPPPHAHVALLRKSLLRSIARAQVTAACSCHKVHPRPPWPFATAALCRTRSQSGLVASSCSLAANASAVVPVHALGRSSGPKVLERSSGSGTGRSSGPGQILGPRRSSMMGGAQGLASNG